MPRPTCYAKKPDHYRAARREYYARNRARELAREKARQRAAKLAILRRAA